MFGLFNMVFFSYCVTVFFFRQKAISLKRLLEVEEVLKVRRQFKTLETPSNTTWLVLDEIAFVSSL